MLKKDISAKLRVPLTKLARGKEFPTSYSKKARQSSTVKVIEDGVSGINVLPRPINRKRTTKPEPSTSPQQDAKKVRSKRRAGYHSSGKVEKLSKTCKGVCPELPASCSHAPQDADYR